MPVVVEDVRATARALIGALAVGDVGEFNHQVAELLADPAQARATLAALTNLTANELTRSGRLQECLSDHTGRDDRGFV